MSKKSATPRKSSVSEEHFRRVALGLPEVLESSHMNHPDFRVAGKIFATLGVPGPGWGMVVLTPDQQRLVVNEDPVTFIPASGAWGRRGCTQVQLDGLSMAKLRTLLLHAWRNTAPKHLL